MAFAWLASLPDVVAGLERRWGVTTGAPFTAGTSAWVAPAERGGVALVLKVVWPHPEAREEAAGLEVWAGRGAVRLVERDRGAWALLLERCDPGLALVESPMAPEDALVVGAEVLSALWSAPLPPDAPTAFDDVAAVCGGWADLVRERMATYKPPFDAGLVEAAAVLLETLPAAPTRSVLVHGDANPGNILSSCRDGWLAIDPKPMVGDPAYDPSPLLLQVDPPFAHPDPRRVLTRRVDFFADLSGLPADRLVAWMLARTVESALWYLASGAPSEAAESMEEAAVMARILHR